MLALLPMLRSPSILGALMVVNEAREKSLTGVICGQLPPGTRLFAALRAVEDGDRVHFLWRQLLGDCAHLLADVVLAHTFSERPQLAFDVWSALLL
jgi:hypothetical protein